MNITDYLKCVNCGGDLNKTADKLICLSCKKAYDYIDEITVFDGKAEKIAEDEVYYRMYDENASEQYWGGVREKALAENIMDFIKDSPGAVLEAGCGDGFLVNQIRNKKRPDVYVALDMSLERLKRIKNVGAYCNTPLQANLNTRESGGSPKNTQLVKANIINLPFKDNSFDYVICSEVLEHVPDYQKAFEELIRVSRKNVVITVPNNQEPVKVECPYCKKTHCFDGHINKFNKGNVAELLDKLNNVEKYGFKKFHTIFTYNNTAMKLPRFFRKFFDWAAAGLEKPFSFFKPNYLLIYIKK